MRALISETLGSAHATHAPFTGFTYARRRLFWVVAAAVAYCVLLIATNRNDSLWTDEAFSAYLASQKSFACFLSTLARGDCSDLQAAGYYLYTYVWCHLFSQSEFALRAANIPFIVVFVIALVWIAARVFRARWNWVAPALLPYFWYYASEARAYFAVATISLICFGALLAYFDHPTQSERRVVPWIVLGGLLVGTAFHMLMLLAVFPMLVIGCINHRFLHRTLLLSDWIPAIRGLAIPFLIFFSYLTWTFLRGASYDYSKPTVMSMLSIPYTLFGLSRFGPNRSYSLDVRPYLPVMIAAGLAFGIAVVGIATAAYHNRYRPRFMVLCFALASASLELLFLGLFTQQQFRVRHVASLTPIIVTLLMAAVAQPSTKKMARIAAISASLLAIIFVSADYRMLFLREYKREDHRAAINQAVLLQKESPADIALVADPFAASYYGLDLTSLEPCSPLPDTCDVVFTKVLWQKRTPATYALPWQPPQIDAWLQAHTKNGVRALVIVNDSREFLKWNSIWNPILLRRQPSSHHSVHGFSIYSFG